MSLKVYDYRTDIANVLVTPQIRCRFLKMAVGQFNAGHTHDLGHEIEKPLCFSLTEIDAMIAAQRAAGTVAQAGYMKVYDPAFELAQRAVRDIEIVKRYQG